MTVQLEYATQADVPAELSDSFVEFKKGENDVVFMHKDLAATNKQLYATMGELTSLQGKNGNLHKMMDEQKSSIQKKAEEAKNAALSEQMAKFKEEGNHSEAFKLELQQKDVAINGFESQINDLNGQIEKMTQANVAKDQRAFSIKLASVYADQKQVEGVAQLIMNELKTEGNTTVLLNASGNAVPNDADSMIDTLSQHPVIGAFRGKPNSKSAYGGKGGSGATGNTISRKDFENMNPNAQRQAIGDGKKIID